MSNVNQQLEQIAASLEDSDGKLSGIVNGGINTVVQTGSGPQPSYAKWRHDKESDFEELVARAEAAADSLTNFGVSSIIALTQTEYDAIASPDPSALYIITGP